MPVERSLRQFGFKGSFDYLGRSLQRFREGVDSDVGVSGSSVSGFQESLCSRDPGFTGSGTFHSSAVASTSLDAFKTL